MKEILQPPSREEIARFPLFPGVAVNNICQPEDPAALAAALSDLKGCPFIGFDTESRPVFKKDQKSDGPHVVQLCTPETVYIFQTNNKTVFPVICQIMADKQVVKAGFGLQSDRSQIRHKFGVEIEGIIDLDRIYRKLGYRRQLGIKAAIAVQFGQKFIKSKRVTTSNWAKQALTEAQLLYAANDAYAALKILQGLQASGHETLIRELIS